jgi:hypothetical protein
VQFKIFLLKVDIIPSFLTSKHVKRILLLFIAKLFSCLLRNFKGGGQENSTNCIKYHKGLDKAVCSLAPAVLKWRSGRSLLEVKS